MNTKLKRAARVSRRPTCPPDDTPDLERELVPEVDTAVHDPIDVEFGVGVFAAAPTRAERIHSGLHHEQPPPRPSCRLVRWALLILVMISLVVEIINGCFRHEPPIIILNEPGAAPEVKVGTTPDKIKIGEVSDDEIENETGVGDNEVGGSGLVDAATHIEASETTKSGAPAPVGSARNK